MAGGRREGGAEEIHLGHKMCTHSACDVSVCSVMTDVALVSMGRYPILKNPFKLVKPLTHKTLGSERLCVCVHACMCVRALRSVTICLLIASAGLCVFAH